MVYLLNDWGMGDTDCTSCHIEFQEQQHNRQLRQLEQQQQHHQFNQNGPNHANNNNNASIISNQQIVSATANLQLKKVDRLVLPKGTSLDAGSESDDEIQLHPLNNQVSTIIKFKKESIEFLQSFSFAHNFLSTGICRKIFARSLRFVIISLCSCD
jgi:hypothetical protein